MFFLGHPVTNWVWDTMLTSHLLDCRDKTNSLKHIAFVMLGILPYNEKVEPLFKSVGTGGLNAIHEIDTEALLIYNGIDSYLEYMVARKQARQMKMSIGE